MSHSKSANPPTDAPTRLEHPVTYEDFVIVEVTLGEAPAVEEAAVQPSAGAHVPPSIPSADRPQGTLVDRIRQRRGSEQ
jgi:hypothetical protein